MRSYNTITPFNLIKMKTTYPFLLFFFHLVCFGQSKDPIYQIPFHLYDNQILIKSKINNETVNLLFDTGCMGVILDKNFILNNKINSLKTYKNPLNFKLHSFYKKIKLISSSDIRKQLGDKYQGIAGVDFFSNYLVEIDYLKQKINLYNLNSKIDRSYQKINTTHNVKNIQIFKRFTTPITLKIDSITKITGNFLIDTGSSRNITTIKLLNKYKPLLVSSKNEKEILNASPHGFNNPIYYRVPKLIFNNKSYDNLIIDDNNDVNHNITGLKGILGGGFLKHFKILINYKNSEIYIKDNFSKIGFTKNIISDGVKIKEYRHPKRKLIIGSVLKNKNGLKIGDNVLKINNIDYQKIQLEKYYLGKKNNDTINYTVKRNGKILKIKTVVKKMFSREE